MNKELLQQALDLISFVAGHFSRYDLENNPNLFVRNLQEAISKINEAIAQPVQPAGTPELSALLFEVRTQVGNGMVPWPIEDAYEAYVAAAAKETS